MTPYDVAMVVIVVAGMVWGAVRGLTWQLASLASLVLGYGASHPLSAQLAPYCPGDPLVARALAMIGVYVAVSGGVFLAAWLVRATLRRWKFEAYDRHLGMVLGGAEGALLGVIVTLFVISLAPRSRGPIFESPTGKVVGRVMTALGPVLPSEARGLLPPLTAADGPDAGAGADPLAAGVVTPAPRGLNDAAVAPASLESVIREGEARLGKAIADGAAEGVRGAVAGAGGGDDGTVTRR